MKEYPNKLYHKLPSWVEPGSVFHIRIRTEFSGGRQLIDQDLATKILQSVEHYSRSRKWFCHLFIIMPDHVHALLSFPLEKSMSRIVGDWKHYHAKVNKVLWQDNYFDHRIRNGDSFVEKAHYIRMNPVRAGLCKVSEEWPWIIEQS